MLGFSTAFPQFKKILEGSFYACYHKNIKHKQKRKEEKLREMKQNNKILIPKRLRSYLNNLIL